jgi:hypothetical protein
MGLPPSPLRKRDRVFMLFGRSPSPLPSRPTRPTSTSVRTPLQDPASSKIASDIFAETLGKLNPTDRKTVRDMLPADVSRIDTTIVELHTYASELQQRSVKERWSWEYKGRQIDVSVLMDKIVQFSDKLKSVGDLVASVDPIHIGLPWAGVRAILEVCVLHEMKPTSCLRADQR